jgi:redox-sensitive bicupin YhaK (pirin superfamily)
MSIRPVTRMSQSVPTREGAGVRLRRAFPFGDTAEFDPFLLLDDFRSDNPADYRAGFPWHPHRGIETISYVLAGAVEHQDSLGNRGALGPGDIQWMTAGSGILHQEMPQGDQKGRMHGFQLWANLPSSLKMTKPRYQDVPARDVPEVVEDDGTTIRVLCGRFGGKSGPVEGIAADPRYLDVSVPAGRHRRLAVPLAQRAFAYVFSGSGSFRDASEPRGVETEQIGGPAPPPSLSDDATNRSLVLFDRGDEVVVRAGEQGIRFLLVSGQPIEEPIAWYGPIVMNTEEELLQAQRELRDGTFIRR